MEAATEFPIERRGPRGGWRAVWAAVALTAITVVACGGITPAEHLDAGWYIQIAQGRMAEVAGPYTARFLGPLIARGLVATGWVSLPVAFGLIAVASCLVLSW